MKRLLGGAFIATALGGCQVAGQLGFENVLRAMFHSPHGDRATHQAAATKLFQNGEFHIFVYRLAESSQQNAPSLVICVVPRWWGLDGATKPQVALFDPGEVFLRLPDGSLVRPTGYAIEGICPHPSLNLPPVAFQTVNLETRLVSKREAHGQFSDIILRFGVPQATSIERISLEFGYFSLDGKRHALPQIGFDQPWNSPWHR